MIEKENYFENDELAYEVWKSKYQLNNETLDEFFKRIAREFARLDNFKNVENIDISKLSSYGQKRILQNRYDEFYKLFKDFEYIVPGGSVLAGIGSGKPVSLSNCFVLNTGDSVEELFDTASNMSQIYKRRGGVGVDLSSLRPNGAKVNNAAKTTGGVVPFMELFSQVTNTIGQSGRRGALMLSIDINHPDSPEFITSKQNLSKITGANISVKLNDEFKKAVENDEDYILRWPCDFDTNRLSDYEKTELFPNALGSIEWVDDDHSREKVYLRKIKAKELWDSIIQCAWNSAEPGVLYWNTILDNDPASVYDKYKAVSTNPSLRKGTRVLTDKGIFEIDKLQDLDLIVPNSNNELKQAKCFLSGNDKPLYKISLVGGHEYYCTAEHKWLIDGKKVLTKDIKSGMYLPLIKKSKLFDGALGNYEDGFFIGWLYGDGWYTERGDNGKIQIGMVVNYEEYESIGPKLKEYLDKHCGKDVVNFSKRSNGTYEFNTINENLLKHLNIFKINKKEFGFPETIWENGSEEYRKGFIDGLLSADGSITKTGGIHFVSSKIKIAKDFKELLGFYGIKSSYLESKNKASFPNEVDYDKLYERYDVKIGESFSINHFLSIFKLSNKLKSDKLHMIKEPTDYRAKYKDLIRINTVELTELKEDVWDLTVYDETHTFNLAHTITGNCGEIPLSPYDSCRLIASNLYSLVDMPFTENASINKNVAYSVFYEAQIIGDILVDLELEHVQRIIDSTKGKEKELWENIKEIGQFGRRTGVGILGLGDMYAALNLPYGDIETTEYIMKLKQEAELDATIDLAIINGTFPDYNRNLEYTDNEDDITIGNNKWYKFLQKEFPMEYLKMMEFGRRNISFSTIAPTGTISILAGTSSGCEPVFSLYYTRRKKCNPGETPDFVDDNGVGFKNFNVIHPKLQIWYNTTEKELGSDLSIVNKVELDKLIKQSPWFNNTAGDLIPELRVNTQHILQKYTTHSISSTVNVNNDVTPEFIRDIYNDAWNNELKGITVYRDGCRSGILVKEEKPKQEVITTRPIELECKVEQFKNEKKDWIAIVGLLNGRPYEIFTGPKDVDVFPLPSVVEKGVVIKVPIPGEKARYDFRYVDAYGYTNTLGGLSRVFDKEYWNYGRLISGYLRSGIPIEQVIKIVDGLTFTNKGLNNWKSGVIRSLKQFIPDGTKVHGVSCENCGGTNVVYESGCSICKDCGSSKCG